MLVLKNEKFVLVDKDSEDAENPLAVSFLSMGKNNQYKIVYSADNQDYAITANAASGILAETTLCDNQNVIFEFATQELLLMALLLSVTYRSPRWRMITK